MGCPHAHIHNFTFASALIFLFFFLHSVLSVSWTASRVQSLPQDIMTGYEALHFGDICFALLWHTLNMQSPSPPSPLEPDAYSNTTAILIVFLSDEEHQGIENVHINLVVHHEGCHLYMQDGILPFVKSIEVDLKKGEGQTCPE